MLQNTKQIPIRCFLHVSSEEKRQNIVVLGTECEHYSRHAGLHVEGEEDDPVVADALQQTLTAQYQQLG